VVSVGVFFFFFCFVVPFFPRATPAPPMAFKAPEFSPSGCVPPSPHEIMSIVVLFAWCCTY